ncbi:hypothetical protein Tco_0751586 [Tanacetum coccineum]|uniref:Uncharacterized protein n=1 Tax=Tanacetum coccineum TaxID=301880 RepID=A0ABQ4Z7J6_9ASTR
MGTKVTSSSGSVLEEPEIQKLQMQAKIFKENSLNKLNALKSTTQLLERQTFSGCLLYQQAFAQLFGDSVRTFKFQLSQHMNNLETLLNAETLHEMDSKSALSVIKVQFERFINSDLLKPLDIYSRSFSSDREVRENFRDYTKMTAQTFKETIIQNMNSIEQCIIERASHEQELKMTLKKLSERQLQIQQCKVQEVQSSVTSSGDETSSGIVSDEEIDKQELEAHYGFMAKIQEVLPAESSSTDTPLEQENKTILKQLKKANASLTQELEECKTNLDETSRALGEATSCRDSCLIALQNKQNEFEKYKAFNDRTIDYDILQTKLNETLGLLARKDIDIKEGLKTKAYEISVVNQKHDALPNTANGCKPKPRNWQASMSSRVSNKDVHLGEHRKQKPFLKFNELQCPTCKKCLYSANHDECVLEYLSRLNTRASAQNKDAKSHKTTKRYMPVEKSSAFKKPERQIPTGHRFSNKKTTTVHEKTMTFLVILARF